MAQHTTPLRLTSGLWAAFFAELVTTQPLFAGDSEVQQLLHIFKLLGTPNEQVWPGVSKLPNWHEYPQWNPSKVSDLVHGLDADAVLNDVNKELY